MYTNPRFLNRQDYSMKKLIIFSKLPFIYSSLYLLIYLYLLHICRNNLVYTTTILNKNYNSLFQNFLHVKYFVPFENKIIDQIIQKSGKICKIYYIDTFIRILGCFFIILITFIVVKKLKIEILHKVCEESWSIYYMLSLKSFLPK